MIDQREKLRLRVRQFLSHSRGCPVASAPPGMHACIHEMSAATASPPAHAPDFFFHFHRFPPLRPSLKTSPRPLPRDFFDRPFLTVARDLIGAQFVWRGCGGVIVEAEAYGVTGDAACHTATRPSSREFVRTMPPGTAYVYLNYGIFWLLNVLARDGIVLIRALEPRFGIPAMQRRRGREKLTDLCSGPGKLGVALALNRSVHGVDLTASDQSAEAEGWFLQPEVPQKVITDVRIGISTATELPWRFLAHENPHVSVPAPARQKKRSKSHSKPPQSRQARHRASA
jgi:DNA-3-methyladenine glycosylase